MRTPKQDGANQRGESADNSSVEEHPDSRLGRDLSRERRIKNPTKQIEDDEIADNRNGGYSLKTLRGAFHGGRLTTQAQPPPSETSDGEAGRRFAAGRVSADGVSRS